MQLIIEIILFKVKHFQYLHIWTFLDAIASSSSWCCQSASGHSWPSGAGLAHLAVLAYSSSSTSKLSNPAVCNSAIYRIYRAL